MIQIRRHFLAACGLAVLSVLATQWRAHAAESRPNIVLLFSDDGARWCSESDSDTLE